MTCEQTTADQLPLTPPSPVPTCPLDARRAALSQAVAHHAAVDGRRVESQWDCGAVLVKGKRINHGLHAFLTVMTAGIWAPVWAVLYLANREQRRVITVDDHGRTLITDAA
jgi:hypothetical protein